MDSMEPVRIADALTGIREHWCPHVVAELNGQQVKLVKFQGEFVWHHHAQEDEMFLVVEGEFRMAYRNRSGEEREVVVRQGEFVVVPRGVEHRPSADREVSVMLFEPATTRRLGDV